MKPRVTAGQADAWAWDAIGCWVGDPWSEALGAAAGDRGSAAKVRCTRVVTDILGLKSSDEHAVAATAGIDESAVERVMDGFTERTADPESAARASLVRASADAAREAMMARRAAESLRRDLAAKDSSKYEDELKAFVPVLTAKNALAKLHSLDAGSRTQDARAIALVLAADHLESARGLEPRAKAPTVSPTFAVFFGLAEPTTNPKPGDWIAYLTAAATAAGHPATLSDHASTHDREQVAFANVAAGLADRFEEQGAKGRSGDAKSVAAAYAQRLRAEIVEAVRKAQLRVDATKKTDGAGKAKP